ncbi:MAG: S41 family peptidase [Gemmataceae bacterium]
MFWFYKGLGAIFACSLLVSAANAQTAGYYRQPTIHQDTIIFVSEGDLWKTTIQGGKAVRLTTHPGEEALPAISPDGKTVAFTASYEGPTEVYTISVQGGQPRRWTYHGNRITFVGWTPDNKLLYGTRKYSTLPNTQLITLDVRNKKQPGKRTFVPLAQAADGVYGPNGKTLFFTRLPFQGSHTKRYTGGTVQNLWLFTKGAKEAIPLTKDYAGTSRRPMWWNGRVYFASDRDGIMNVWSMTPGGKDLRQHTKHAKWDVAMPSLHNGKIVYQHGADLYLHDIQAKRSKKLSITLSSDFDQLRENWVKKPMSYLTSVHIGPKGDRVVLTARGQVFVAPVGQGRLVKATRNQGVRHRNAVLMPDGRSLVTLSDKSGEVELWKLPADGVGKPKQLTKDSQVLKWGTFPSPDGKWIASTNKDQELWLYNVKTGKHKQIDYSPVDNISDLSWSPDSQWLAYAFHGKNLFRRIKLFPVGGKQPFFATTDRYGSYSPAWSPDGKWLYFLSDRNLKSVVGSPWGPYQPEPFLDKRTKVYQLALRKGERSPFAPDDELHSDKKDTNNDKEKKDKKDAKTKVTIERKGLVSRLQELPIPPGNYKNLTTTKGALFWTTLTDDRKKTNLVGVTIARKDVKIQTIVSGIKAYELSQDGKKLLVRKGDDLYVIPAAPKAQSLTKAKVDLSGWQLSVIPRNEWRQMFIEAWRLERDYFYDQSLHSVGWKAMLKKYLPLVDRVRSRTELSDVVAQMVSELGALHIFVRGGDTRKGNDSVQPSFLGAVLERDRTAGGYRVEHVYKSDPDEPKRRSPLARPGVNVHKGDVITGVNGVKTLSVPSIGQLLRGQAGKQVLLGVKTGQGKSRKVIVRPINSKTEDDLRYHEWEYTRRLDVEKESNGTMGYIHLRAMGSRNFTEWAKDYYPAFTRQGLIIDVRNNRGGNIDSWILNRLIRKAWFYWNQRKGKAPLWNMQYAFRGHIVVLCNEYTASDGEAFSEGIKRLKLGKVIGTRTWGGEIWLSSSNFLVDKGIATAAEYGVYGPEGVWLIEGYGVEPDITVDNLPHATFQGRDAQLEAAIKYLRKKIKEDPVPVPPVPEFPNKRFPPRQEKQEQGQTNGAKRRQIGRLWPTRSQFTNPTSLTRKRKLTRD